MGLFSFFNAKSSLSNLSALDNNRLSDLGLNRYDLFDARHLSSRKAGNLLSERRSQRAHFWLR